MILCCITTGEEKYARIVHGEMNALIFAERSVEGATLYTWPFMPCDRCVVHMIQAGIKLFVTLKAKGEQAERWEPTFAKTRKYILETKSALYEYESFGDHLSSFEHEKRFGH